MLSPRLNELVSEFGMIERALGDPATFNDQKEYRRLTARHRDLEPLVSLYKEYADLQSEQTGSRELLGDPDFAEIAQSDLSRIEARMAEIEAELEVLLLPTDPYDANDTILEIRAGAGGAEAALFAADLLRMYSRYAENSGLRLEVLDSNESDIGGLSKVVCEVAGDYAYRAFKWESGVHRVQRVPATESQGRIHTSTATVAVLPQVEQAEVDLDMNEVRVDVFRSQGAGGQSVNTTDSAVRVTYKAGTPEEIMVVCQDGRSQIKNREKALTILAARLAEREREKQQATEREARSSQIGSGDRSEKVRTYNYPQNRVTDHRLEGEVKNFPLDSVIDGKIEDVVAALARAQREQQLLEMNGTGADRDSGGVNARATA